MRIDCYLGFLVFSLVVLLISAEVELDGSAVGDGFWPILQLRILQRVNRIHRLFDLVRRTFKHLIDLNLVTQAKLGVNQRDGLFQLGELVVFVVF